MSETGVTKILEASETADVVIVTEVVPEVNTPLPKELEERSETSTLYFLARTSPTVFKFPSLSITTLPFRIFTPPPPRF